jgi:hypothetical protein
MDRFRTPEEQENVKKANKDNDCKDPDRGCGHVIDENGYK